MDYVKYYELIVDEANKKRVNELYSLKEEATIKGDTGKIVEVEIQKTNNTEDNIKKDENNKEDKSQNTLFFDDDFED